MSDTRAQLVYDANKKSVLVAYLLWFFFGMFGAHRFYLNKGGTGAAILLMSIGSILLAVVFIGLVTILIPAIWVFIDLFLIPGLARDYNMRLIDHVA